MGDRIDCPAFELLATAYHEAWHAVGATLVFPALVVESATIIPGDDYQGLVTYEEHGDLIVPDPADEDGVDEICEHERQYLEAHDILSYLGALSEGRLRAGSLETPTLAGWGADRDTIVWNAHVQMGDDIWRKAGRGAGWAHAAHSPAAVALTERHPHFWLAVGLVAGALMREKTLDGSEVEALVRVAQRRAVRVARQQPAQRLGRVRDHALVALDLPRSQHGHRDGLFVHVQADVCRLFHGRSLRVSAPRAHPRG